MIRRWMMALCALMVLTTGLIALPAQAQGDPTVYDPAVCANDLTGGPLSDACTKMIATYPFPPGLDKVEQDRLTLSTYDFWRVGPGAVDYYDSPGGNVIGQIPPGYNFVNVVEQTEGWIRTQDGRWISKQNATAYTPSYFTGIRFTSNDLTHPFAWILDKSNIFVSSYPGGPMDRNTGRFLRRYELVNIYAVAKDADGWRWYMIGPNQWVKQTFVGKVQRVVRPQGVSGRWVAIDLYEQVLVAYQDDKPVFATLISSGLPKTETVAGLYKVWARLERDGMSGAAGAPNAYALQSVPWVMYFDGSASLHGTYWHDLFGYRQSRGCVNMTISDARWLFKWFEETEPDATGETTNWVYVYASGEYGEGVIRGN